MITDEYIFGSLWYDSWGFPRFWDFFGGGRESIGGRSIAPLPPPSTVTGTADPNGTVTGSPTPFPAGDLARALKWERSLARSVDFSARDPMPRMFADSRTPEDRA